MPKRAFSRKSKGQLELFPEAYRPAPQAFAEKLHGSKMIAAKIMRERPKKGAKMSIDVRKEVAEAYARLERLQGVNVKALLATLANAKSLKAHSVIGDPAIFEPVKRSDKEMREIKKAVETLVYFVNRNRNRKAWAKVFAKSKAEHAELYSQKSHLKDI